ncbi:MAG: helix-turn-helix domain-containing protein [Pirellulales bacterium]|nr:helix-turn-helix domain-containing protein [Pirellulales bacterium]
MAQRYYNVSETAKLLGTSEENVRQMQERREVHGYRDGADWKFKAEDIEKLASERKTAPVAEEEHDEVLMSELELGQASDAGASGTVIGMDDRGKKTESTARFSDSDLQLDTVGGPAAAKKDPTASQVSQFEELDLTLDEDLTLEDSSVSLGEKKPPPPNSSSVMSGIGEKKQDDDDLVLGGSGAGSGVTLGGDSGISLVDPADSGLSLEEPLEIGGGAGESLELGEDDLLVAGDSAKGKAGGSGSGDFLLTPAEDAADLEDSESGSQVIALDAEGEGDEAATMIASRQDVSMATMLEEDAGPAPSGFPVSPVGMAPLGLAPAAAAEGAAVVPSAALLPEAPYTPLNVASLAVCVVCLSLCGMMMFELVRNLGSYNQPGGIPGWLMDTVLKLFGVG